MYINNKNKAKEIPFKLEKDIQKNFESNLHSVKNSQLVK